MVESVTNRLQKILGSPIISISRSYVVIPSPFLLIRFYLPWAVLDMLVSLLLYCHCSVKWQLASRIDFKHVLV